MSLIEKAIEKLNESAAAPPVRVESSGVWGETDAVLRHVHDVPVVSLPQVDAESSAREPSPAHIERAGQGPRVRLKIEQMRSAGLLTPDAPQSGIAEEYRHIKRPLLKNTFGQGVAPIEHGNLVMITSARPSEGKTFNAMSLAVSIAMEFDKTVLLVDADLARPSVDRFLDLTTRPPGLVDYLLDGSADLGAFLLKTDIPKLNILPAGRHHPNATELLASEGMRDLTIELSERYRDRIIIFDSPPLLANSQASALAAHVGQILVVVEANKTSQSILKEALSLLDTGKGIGLNLEQEPQISAQGRVWIVWILLVL